jgi:HSP20 family protein
MKLMKKWHKPEHGNGHALVRRHPGESGLRPLTELRREMDDMFNRLWRNFGGETLSPVTWAEPLDRWTAWPAMDLTEDDRTVKLEIDVPGMDEKDVSVEVSGNVLTVRGCRRDEHDESKKGIHRIERVCGSFSRSVTLPSYVDLEKIHARYGKGTLTITVPKIQGREPKRVDIQTT